VRYELGSYIPEDGILHSTAVKTSNLNFIEGVNAVTERHASVLIKLKLIG
jgi:hypothetical protein